MPDSLEKKELKKKVDQFSPEELREKFTGGGEWIEIRDNFRKAFLECPNCGGLLSVAGLFSYMIASCPTCGKNYIYKPEEEEK